MSIPSLLYPVIFLYGIVIGSFLNVCIYRIPEQKSIVTGRSHCMDCGHQLAWYELIPLFSWIFLKGRCKNCNSRISVQYPVIEGVNGLLWVITFALCGFHITSVLYCFFLSALLVLSVIDIRTYEIPLGINLFIGVLGVIRVSMDFGNLFYYIAGFFLVSGIFYVVYRLTNGNGIGGGDIKLMAVAGLLLGWQEIFLAMIAGCLYGSVIHILRMKFSGADKMLAMGPYLSMGLVTVCWFGKQILDWYARFFI